MKKTITGVVALLAGAFAAYSQGTVSLGNYLDLGTYIYVKYNGTKLGGSGGTPTTGTPTANVAAGNDWTVALYGASGLSDAASSLTECTVSGGGVATATFANGTSDKVAGTWYSGTAAIISGTTGAGQTATLQLYAWYNAGGTITSYSAASVRGVSALANLTSTGGPNASGPPSTPPALPSGLGNFNVTAVTPEPSTVLLGIMGASGMFLRLRRKK
jgi:hypothetical protein